MPRKITDTDVDYAIDAIRNGSTAKSAAQDIGINHATLYGHLKKRGFDISRNSKISNRVDLPIDDIKSMYENGKSVNAISKHFSVSRGVINKRLREIGISPRSQSEAEKLKWSQMDKESRAKQIKAAHDAVRGKPSKFETRFKIAAARERLKYDHLIGHGEVEFCELLSNRGIDFVHQKAIGSYNVDIAIGNVAVELTSYRGRYAMFNPKEINRAEKLLECGYHVVAVEFDSTDTLIRCADDVLAHIQDASRLKPVNRQYWVVRCRMQDYTIIQNDLGQFTRVPAPVEFLTKRTVIELD